MGGRPTIQKLVQQKWFNYKSSNFPGPIVCSLEIHMFAKKRERLGAGAWLRTGNFFQSPAGHTEVNSDIWAGFCLTSQISLVFIVFVARVGCGTELFSVRDIWYLWRPKSRNGSGYMVYAI